MFAQGAMRRHRNQASGSAIATAIAAEQTASVTEAISAQPPFRIGEDLAVPGQREALRRESQVLLLVDRDAGNDDQRQRQEQGDQEEIEAGEARSRS